MRITRIAPHRGRLAVAIAALAIAVPSPALGAAGSGPVDPNATGYVTSSDPFVVSSGAVEGVTFRPLINSGEEAFGTLFEGIPDGIGVVPGPAPHGYVDLYVNHEQSRVPFGGFADFNDSSVSRVRVDIASKEDPRPQRRPVLGRGLHQVLLLVHGRSGARLPALHAADERRVE